MSENELQLTQRARQVLLLSKFEAGRLSHPAVLPEHVLLALIRDGDCLAARILRHAVPNIESLRDAIEELLGPGDPTTVPLQIPFDEERSKRFFIEVEALRESLRHPHVDTEHLLFALTRHPERPLTRLLQSFHITPETVLLTVLTGAHSPQIALSLDARRLYPLFAAGRLPVGFLHELLREGGNTTGAKLRELLLKHGLFAQLMRLAGEAGLPAVTPPAATSPESAAPADAESRAHDLPSLELAAEFRPDQALIHRFPADLARRLVVFPLRFEQEEDTIYLAVTDPADSNTINEIQGLWGVNVVALRAPEPALRAWIERYFPPT